MAAEIEDNQGRLKISPNKREVGWLLDLYALVETSLHFYRGFDRFVKELSDHRLDFFLLGSFSALSVT